MKKKLTVGEALEEVGRLQLKQAVTTELVEYLRQFISTDSFEPTKGIASTNSADVVPQDIIEEVRDELLASQKEAENQIRELKGQSIAGAPRTTKKAPVKKAPRKVPPKKRRTTSVKRK